uniref:Copia protein n=1 Tax=Cajanus cajan TaxID=3821 RepID=A0A151TZ63_CAJCA|nr:Copia protein [Cajanus cajan]
MHNPFRVHWPAAKRILRYLNGTIDYCLHFNKINDLNISAFCDSDWASDPNDLRSTSSYYMYLGNYIVSWAEKKQRVVSKSSTEAKFKSLSVVASEIAYIQNLLIELQIPITTVPLIWCDNQGFVLLFSNPSLHRKTKHFELDLWYIWEKVARGELIIKHVLARFQVADLLTKAPFWS